MARRLTESEVVEAIHASLADRPEAGKMIEAYIRESSDRCTHAERRFKRLDQEFATVLEIVNQISARSMEIERMQSYLVRTIMGQFMVPRILVLRAGDETSAPFAVSAAQGVEAEEGLTLPSDGALAAEALARGEAIGLAETAGREKTAEEAARFSALGMEVAVPLILSEEPPRPPTLEGFLFLGPRLVGGAFSPTDLRFLRMIGSAIAIAFHHERLYRRSIVDDLTRVSSRGHFEAHLAQEVGRVNRYGGTTLSLVMLDLDHFKNVNDTHGHPAGDLVLQNVAAALRREVRTTDLVARYGGEEFTVILLEIAKESALEVAARLRSAIAEIRTPVKGGETSVTASLGVASYPDDAADRRSLIEAADAALYRAKEAGRDRVEAAPSLEEGTDGAKTA